MHRTTSTRLALASAAGALAHSAGAAITVGDFSSAPISISATNQSIYIDLDAAGGIAASSLGSGPTFTGRDITLNFSNSNLEKPSAVGSNSWMPSGPSGNTLSKLTLNSPLGAKLSTNIGYLENTNVGQWHSPNDGFGYGGFQKGVGAAAIQAWIYINYNDLDHSITLHKVGYNDSGTILAGQTSAVPEAASSAVIAALLAGGVAAFQRRRKAA
jgi:hypothetical protein